MTYEEIVTKLTSKSFFSKFAGLYRMKKTMDYFGNPEENLNIVHVAGTNGKGSVCSMLHAVLAEAGYKVGLYTSPYIHDIRERIQINGKLITKERLVEICEEVFAYTDKLPDKPNQFELLTMIALLYFEREHCDIVILETGLGGTYDPTNIVMKPLCSVIMNIGLDHCAVLGNSIAEIADAKAGIIKHNCDVVVYPSKKEAVDVITAMAFKKNATIHYVDCDAIRQLEPEDGFEHFLYNDMEIRLSLLGKHQQKNCAVALDVIRILNKGKYFITDSDIRNGLSHVHWPVRMERLHRNPDIYLDGGHNPQCIQAAKEFFETPAFAGKKIHVLTGILGDKDYRTMLGILKSFSDDIAYFRFEHPRAIPEEELPALCEEFGMRRIDNPEEELAGLEKDTESVVLCIGSLYMSDRIRSIYVETER